MIEKTPPIKRREAIRLTLAGLSGLTLMNNAQEIVPYTPRITAWMHRNDWYKAVQSASEVKRGLIELSPLWYSLSGEGVVLKAQDAFVNDELLLSVAEQRNLIIRPIVSNVLASGTQPSIVLDSLRNEGSKEAHLRSIVESASHYTYNGIDLDYEGFRGSEMEAIAILTEELSKRLHSINKSLAVCIEVQLNNEVLPHWEKIGQYADLVRIMVYSEHTERTAPGPIASLEWSRRRLEHVLKVIPTAKLSYGMAIYGRLWGIRNYSATWENLSRYAGSAEIFRNEDGIPWYVREGEEVWFEDAESVRRKIELGRSLGIDAYSFWRLGGEDPGIWNMIQNL